MEKEANSRRRDELIRWIITTLFPIIVIGIASYMAVRIKVAELNQDVGYIKDKVTAIEATLKEKSDKETVDEIKKDMKEIKMMFMNYALSNPQQNNPND